MRDFYAAVVASGKVNDVLALGRGFFARSIEERLRLAGVHAEPTQLAAQAHALAGSLFALIDWWIDRGMKTDPKEVDAIFHRMAWSGIHKQHRPVGRFRCALFLCSWGTAEKDERRSELGCPRSRF